MEIFLSYKIFLDDDNDNFFFFFGNYRLKSVCNSYLEIHCLKCECVLGHDESLMLELTSRPASGRLKVSLKKPPIWT